MALALSFSPLMVPCDDGCDDDDDDCGLALALVLKAASTISLMVVWQYLVKVSSMPSSEDDRKARR